MAKVVTTTLSSSSSSINQSMLSPSSPSSSSSSSLQIDQQGVFVVKELILLDCIHTYYYKKRSLLSDEEYNELKDSLSWEGSVAVTLTAKEAHFISAVSAFRRLVFLSYHIISWKLSY